MEISYRQLYTRLNSTVLGAWNSFLSPCSICKEFGPASDSTLLTNFEELLCSHLKIHYIFNPVTTPTIAQYFTSICWTRCEHKNYVSSHGCLPPTYIQLTKLSDLLTNLIAGLFYWSDHYIYLWTNLYNFLDRTIINATPTCPTSSSALDVLTCISLIIECLLNLSYICYVTQLVSHWKGWSKVHNEYLCFFNSWKFKYIHMYRNGTNMYCTLHYHNVINL